MSSQAISNKTVHPLGRRFSFYLIREILPLYITGVVILLVLLMMVVLLDVLADVISRGASPTLVAQFLLYSIPSLAGLGLPLALLFAALLGITRLGQDSEIKAGLLLGLSPSAFVTPLMVLGLLVSIFTFSNNEFLAPWMNQRALEVQKDILIQSPEVVLEEGSFFTDGLGRNVHIGRLEAGGIVKDITVIQSNGSQGPKEVIYGAEGKLDEQAGLWRLQDVRMTSYRNSDVVLDVQAETATVPTRALAASNLQPELTQLPLREIFARIRNNPSGGSKAEWTALHRKLAEPLAATAFALFALAVGLFSFRSGFGLGLVSVLFLTFIYYATWSVANVLGANGTIPAWFAGWMPVMLYASVALVLLALSWWR